MVFKKRKKGIITVFALLLAACLAGGVFSVSAKYSSKSDSVSTFVQVSLMLDPNYTDAADSEWRTVSPVNGQAMPSVTPPSRDGYVFTGYYSADGSAGHEQNDGNRYYKNDGTSNRNWDASCNVLYAGWEGSFRITFDAGTNGGTIKDSTDTQKELYAKNGAKTLYTERNAAVTAAAPSAEHTEKDHYYFDGWYTSAAGGIKKVEYDGTVLSDWTGLTDDSTVLYAQYKPYTYVVTFDGNAPSGKTVTGTTANWEKTYVEAASALSANGYSVTDNTCVFVGWMTASDGTIRQFTNEQSVTVRNLLDAGALVTADIDRTKKNITLYARWSVVHTVTFKNMTNATGTVVTTYYEFDGTLYTDSTLITQVEEMPSAGNGSRSGLSYWTTTKTGRIGTGSSSTPAPLVVSNGAVQGGTTYTDDQGHSFTVNDMSYWTLESNITLYAVWYKINYYKDTKQIPGNSGFTELEYIESTNGGGQYIDTEYLPPFSATDFYSRVKFSMMPTSLKESNNIFYMAGRTSERIALLRGGWFIFRSDSGNAYWNVGFKGNNYGKKQQHSISVNSRYSYDVRYRYGKLGTPNSLVIGSTDADASGTADNWQGQLGDGNHSLLFFRGTDTYSSYYSAAKLYYLKLYSGSGDTLQKNLVPARWKGGSVRYSYQGNTSTGNIAAGTVGLYDTVSETFFINSGSGTFLTQADYIQENLIYGEPVTIAYSPADCGYTSINDTSFAASSCAGWTYQMQTRSENDFVKDNSYNNIYEYVSSESQPGNVFVNLYTGKWVAPSSLSKAVFRSPNKDIEYVYVEPVNKEDGNVIEEENINE